MYRGEQRDRRRDRQGEIRADARGIAAVRFGREFPEPVDLRARPRARRGGARLAPDASYDHTSSAFACTVARTNCARHVVRPPARMIASGMRIVTVYPSERCVTAAPHGGAYALFSLEV